jgi:quinoprotein relay system zinc metallohydrolase 1
MSQRVVAAALSALCCAMVLAQANIATLDYQLKPRPLAQNTWVIEGANDDFTRANGCNIINTAFVATTVGTVVINTGPSWTYGKQQRAVVARMGQRAVVRVLNLNLHPDYFFGNQAWGDVPTQALAGTRAGMQAEGKAYEDNLYRLCGDWMKATQSTPSQASIEPGEFTVGGHSFLMLRLSGHTSDDLVVVDRTARVLYAGGLVFMNRVPTFPHANVAAWIASLETLRKLIATENVRWVVPSHGPVHEGFAGIEQTLDWLLWIDATMRAGAAAGLDISEVLQKPPPARFQNWAALKAEYTRNVTSLYPEYERQALQK